MAKIINAYDRALIQINAQILKMSELVDRKLSQAMDSLINQDEKLARMLIEGDDEVDLLDEELEMNALEIISLQQPVDSDLRFLTSAIRISHELERIGDYACDIAEISIMLIGKGPYFKPLVDIPYMGELVKKMMHKSINAYIKKDLTSAMQLDDDDWDVDKLFQRLFKELTDYMKSNPELIEQASNLLLVARYLERIGDHIVNIAEKTVFSLNGESRRFKSTRAGMMK